MRVAIVGTGISGMVAAHRLHGHHELTVYEAGERIGGHTNTVPVLAAGPTHWIDTGFIVFNDRNYPRFESLLAELGVPTQPSQMSFSVSDGADFEYAGTPRGLLARPANFLDPAFLRMLREWRRFNREAPALIGMNGDSPSLGEWLEQRGYSEHFVERLIVPQASAVWSADPAQMWSFPASFMAEFFDNHGMYSLRNRPRWRTVSGGSRRYVEAIAAPWRHRVRLDAPVRRIERLADGGVLVEADGCESERFDQVVVATHSDQALAMLADPSQAEREILGAIPYQRNDATLHTDTALLPRRRAAWSSWNFHLAEPPGGGTTVTYWMNNLQRLRAKRDFLVTLNRARGDRPGRSCTASSTPTRSTPVPASPPRPATPRSAACAGIHYCGAYWGWGFHEDGVRERRAVCEGIARAEPVAGAAAQHERLGRLRGHDPPPPLRTGRALVPLPALPHVPRPRRAARGSSTGSRSGRPAAPPRPASAAPTSWATRSGRWPSAPRDLVEADAGGAPHRPGAPARRPALPRPRLQPGRLLLLLRPRRRAGRGRDRRRQEHPLGRAPPLRLSGAGTAQGRVLARGSTRGCTSPR